MELNEILSHLENFHNNNLLIQREVLSNSLNYITDSRYSDKILFFNLIYHAYILSNDDNSETFRLLNIIENNRIETEKALNPENIANLFRIIKEKHIYKRFLDRKDYGRYVLKIFDNLGINLRTLIGSTTSSNSNTIFKHFLIIYGLENVLSIREDLIDIGISPESCEDIDVINYISYFQRENSLDLINPHFFYTYLQKSSYKLYINDFLSWVKLYFDQKKPNHIEWLSIIIEKSIEAKINLDFNTYASFKDRKGEVPILDIFFKNHYPNVLIKEIYLSNLKILNLKMSNKKLLEIKNFKDLVFKFYRNDSKKIVKLLSSICIKNGCIDFSYIYLGQLINHLDINHIQKALNFIKENEFPVNIQKPFSEMETNLLNYTKSFISGRNVIDFLFSNPKFSYIELNYFLIRSFKYVQNKIFVLEKKPKNIEDMINVIDSEVSMMINHGFELPVEESINNLSFDNYKIVFPKTSRDLIWWGRDMANCLTGENWSISVFSKKSFIFGIFIENNLIYCVEIENRKIKQFEGKRREKPKEEFRLKVENLLKSNNVID